jgi:hypothetical protein
VLARSTELETDGNPFQTPFWKLESGSAEDRLADGSPKRFESNVTPKTGLDALKTKLFAESMSTARLQTE